jgi:hypothetical protein
MKNLLFLIFLSFGLFQQISAQNIELIGEGVLNTNEKTLIISEPGTVDKVVVEATGIYIYKDEPGTVEFSDNDEIYTVSSFNEVDVVLCNGCNTDVKRGYFTAEFNTFDGEIKLDKLLEGNNIISFVAYVYREGDDPQIYNEVIDYHAFLFHNGEDDPLLLTSDLPASAEPRNIEISIPFTDLVSGEYDPPRTVDITLSSGTETVNTRIAPSVNNMGDLLHIETILLENVPGDLTDVEVKIYSPNSMSAPDWGDSFITGSILLSTTVIEDGGCTLTQGYWKTHSEYGPAPYDENWANLSDGADTEFYISGMSWHEVFWTPPQGNVYYQLAHQYMAAHLNMLAGAMAPPEVITAMKSADELFGENNPGDLMGRGRNANMELQAWFRYLAELLDDYNNGIIGPGHCDDLEEWGMEKSAQIPAFGDEIAKVDNLTVYPNPVISYATVSFMPLSSGTTTVDLYNSTGQAVKRLFSKKVTNNIPVNFTLTTAEFSEGLYFLVVRNGDSQETAKISIK